MNPFEIYQYAICIVPHDDSIPTLWVEDYTNIESYDNLAFKLTEKRENRHTYSERTLASKHARILKRRFTEEHGEVKLKRFKEIINLAIFEI